MKIISVVGARPNFMKIAPFIQAIKKYNQLYSQSNRPSINHLLVHTGQHYDSNMSNNFFQELNIPEADINLGVGSGTHAEQVGYTMIAFEKVLKNEKPDWVVVVGDVNATLACSITAKKELIKLCHIEAGLRSCDITMPEEINRIVTDRLSDLLLTPDNIATENLLKEGIDKRRIVFVGNIMIDTLIANREKALKIDINNIIYKNLFFYNSNLPTLNSDEQFIVVTFHRPSNVDSPDVLTSIVKFLIDEVAKCFYLIWPLHPRTKRNLINFGLMDLLTKHPKIFLLNPLGYLDMLRLNMSARVVLTDSGGLQEECTVLGTPCLTLRWTTERPVTLVENGGVSVLVGNNIEIVRREFHNALQKSRVPYYPDLWDGHTAERCLNAILNFSQTF